jgi:hypothetical protein
VKAGAGRLRRRVLGGFGFEDALNIFMRDFGGFGGFEELFNTGPAGRRRTGARTCG